MKVACPILAPASPPDHVWWFMCQPINAEASRVTHETGEICILVVGGEMYLHRHNKGGTKGHLL